MDMDIHEMNEMSLENTVIILIISGLLRTEGRIPKTRKFNIKQDKNDMAQHAVDEITLWKNNKFSA